MVARASLARDRQLTVSRYLFWGRRRRSACQVICGACNTLRIIRIGNVAQEVSRECRVIVNVKVSRECREVVMSEYAIVICRSICVTRVGSTIQR